MRKSLIWLTFFFIILTTYKPRYNDSFIPKLNIEKIIIANNLVLTKKELNNKLRYIYEKNLFFLDQKVLKDKLLEIQFIESFTIKKIYPKTLKITIYEKQPVALFYKGKKNITLPKKGI